MAFIQFSGDGGGGRLEVSATYRELKSFLEMRTMYMFVTRMEDDEEVFIQKSYVVMIGRSDWEKSKRDEKKEKGWEYAT